MDENHSPNKKKTRLSARYQKGEKDVQSQKRSGGTIVFQFVAVIVCVAAFFGALYFQKLQKQKELPWQGGIGNQPTLLVSMVRDEQQHISRMLHSASMGTATHVFICDTGSTDKTISIARSLINATDYDIASYKWENFAKSRNKCLTHAIKLAKLWEVEWIMFLDADQRVERVHTELPEHGLNLVSITEPGNAMNVLPYLVHASVVPHCEYICDTHEILSCEEDSTSAGRYNGIRVLHASKGKGYKNYQRDIKTIHAALSNMTNDKCPPSRYHFYLARSYDDLGKYKEAAKWYDKRIETQNWYQERWYALYRRAVCEFSLPNYTVHDVESLFLRAHDAPGGVYRREALYYLARLHRINEKFSRCLVYSTAGLFAPPVNHEQSPFLVERHLHTWALKEEHALCLYYMGYKQEALGWWENALATDIQIIPKTDVERIRKSMSFFAKK